MLSFLLGKGLRVGWPNHIEATCFAFREAAKPFSKVVVPLTSPQAVKTFSHPTFFPALVMEVFLILAIPIDRKWYLIVL